MKNLSDKSAAILPEASTAEVVAGPPELVVANQLTFRFARKIVINSLLLGLIPAGLMLLAAPSLREMAYAVWPYSNSQSFTNTTPAKLKREIRSLEGRVANLQNRFKGLTPRDAYLIVNTSTNQIFLKAGDKIVHEGICSTGSYVLLKASGDRQWVFVTPRGMFRILGKRVAPVWTKPDWAFVEEGLPIPPPYAPERYEAGVLGEYALELGDGYLIHGTLYKRMLGMPVTHGCVRLDDEDLR
ncbi:MAG TPA: L,D-transpeptidase, partial [bacterium]